MISFLVAVSLASAESPWPLHTIDGFDAEQGKRGADGVRLANVNGDGLPDVTTGWEEGGAVRVCLHPGHDKAGGIWPAVTVGSVTGVEDAVFADLDGDGAIDVVSCAEGKVNRVSVHWAPSGEEDYLDSEKWSTEAFPASEGRHWMFAVPMDVNGDRKVDLVVGSKGKRAIAGWLENPGNATASRWWIWTRTATSTS
ncbi:hypothetical protein BH23VER1_BH23VER1_20700 [soil metagenome]